MEKSTSYTMADIRAILGFLLLCHSVSSLALTGPSVHAVRLGSDALVPCMFTVNNPPVDPKHLAIFWLFQDKEILSYRETVKMTSSRYSLSTDALSTGNASLVIPNIRILDGGMYKCSVIYSSDRKEKEVRLDIGAPPQVTVTNKSAVMNEESVLRCSFTGFYPVDIDVKWFQDRERLNVIPVEHSLRNPDRTYSVNSSVTITPTEEDRDRIFSCRVQHEFLQKPHQEDFRLVYEDYRWRPVVEDIQIPRILHDTPAVLQCHVSEYFPGAIIVKWRRGAEDKMYEEADTAGNQSVTSRREADNTYSCTARLTITPTLQTHQRAEYICLVEHPALEEPIEKSTGRIQVIAEPQMLVPIEITMADSSRVQFSLNLQKFYPKDIQISWHWEGTSGKYGLSATEKITTQDDHVTYDITSVVSIANYVFKDPEIKIIVIWKHEAMEIPETRSLSIRDLPWRPYVKSINVPKLEDERQAQLTCDISGYFPDLLSVSWFLKKDGDLTALPKERSKTERTYKISHNERRKDKTYNYEASLTFTPLISSDQGSEIICRVEHPSQEHPIERSTGPLHIDTRPKFFRSIRRSSMKVKVGPGTKNEEAQKATEDIGAGPLEEGKDPTPEKDTGS